MTVRLAPTPASLYRIGRTPDPLAFPPIAFSGSGRYDDPERRRSTLYAAVERRAVFLETLDAFRPDLAALEERDTTLGDVQSAPPPPQSIPDRFLKRAFVRFRLAEGQRWLDVRVPETHAVLREELGSALVHAGKRERFVLGDLLANDHDLTRLVAGWAIDHAFDGIAYASCHNPALTCWAIFGGAALLAQGPARPINLDDPDLHAVARLWNLRIPGRAVR
ncbi:MAG: RES domain-containing protein [Thermomicrobiales bacterium]|nr:RES domain-containing protein [Thermomicrobiales bacterium]MCO5223614.1 RES domain-containing protein [Thermomicrobiales bacterium]